METIVVFLLIIILSIICFFILIPIKKIGMIKFLFYERQMNPIMRKIIDKYLGYKYDVLINSLIKSVEVIDETKIPSVAWIIDPLFKGIESLYCLDQYSDDVRCLLSTSEDIIKDEFRWFNAFFTNQYIYNPLCSPNPRYEMEKGNDWIKIKTAPMPDTWIYLASKDKYPNTYALDFDIILHQEMEETLQLCFYCQSLAKRLRFVLDKNKYLRFEIVDRGVFSSQWHKLNKRYSLPLHKPVNIRLEIIDNIVVLYINYICQMAIRIINYKLENGYWYILFWNGKQDNKIMKIEISNLKVYLRRNINPCPII